MSFFYLKIFSFGGDIFNIFEQACYRNDKSEFPDQPAYLKSSNQDRLVEVYIITKTRLFKYIENFTIKKEKISKKKNLIFFIYLLKTQIVGTRQNRQGGSNECPQSMFLSRNKKNNVDSCKPQFDYIKVGFKGVKIIQVCFRDGDNLNEMQKHILLKKKKKTFSKYCQLRFLLSMLSVNERPFLKYPYVESFIRVTWSFTDIRLGVRRSLEQT